MSTKPHSEKGDFSKRTPNVWRNYTVLSLCIRTFDNVLMRVCAGVHNASHYVLYSSMKRQKAKQEGRL